LTDRRFDSRFFFESKLFFGMAAFQSRHFPGQNPAGPSLFFSSNQRRCNIKFLKSFQINTGNINQPASDFRMISLIHVKKNTSLFTFSPSKSPCLRDEHDFKGAYFQGRPTCPAAKGSIGSTGFASLFQRREECMDSPLMGSGPGDGIEPTARPLFPRPAFPTGARRPIP
jgi:hypothetical protein